MYGVASDLGIQLELMNVYELLGYCTKRWTRLQIICL